MRQEGYPIPVSITQEAASESLWPNDVLALDATVALGERGLVSYYVSQRNLDLVRLQLAAPITNAQIVRNPYGVDYNAAPHWPSSSKMMRLALRRSPLRSFLQQRDRTYFFKH